MKIIIPLAGPNEDFIENFNSIKPLTQVGKIYLLERFVQSFKFNYEYIFLCNINDLLNTDLLNIISKLKIKKKIISLNEKTSNVIETILHSKKYIKKNESIIVLHPDSELFFDKKEFNKLITNKKISGAIFSYDHFNPTYLDSDLVGRAVVNSSNEIKEIKEKSIYNKKEMTLCGVYYYRQWSEFLKYSQKTFQNQKSIDGTFYESQIYNEYINDKKIIKNFKVKKFISLGLIKNINEYNFWHKYHSKNKKIKYKLNFNHINLIPACGKGQRFIDEGYKTIKPLIKVQNTSMLNATLRSLPKSNQNIIIIEKEKDKKYNIKNKFIKNKKNKFILINNSTDGMARTCLHAKNIIPKNKPIIISSCDYSFVYNENKLKLIIESINPDVIIWTFKNYPDARINPYIYAYVKLYNGYVKKIYEKTPISSTPNKDDIVQGVFYFKNKKILFEAIETMIKKRIKVNGEYYIATAINELIKNNMKVVPFEVKQYISWGTPFDLKNYEFWEERFKLLK